MVPRFYAKTRTQWRSWLAKNHGKKKDVWLVFYKKHTKPAMRYTDALDEALCFGWIDSRLKSIDNQSYMVRFTRRNAKSQWSANNVKRYRTLLRQELVAAPGKRAFKNKFRVYMPGKGAAKWHLANRMPRNPTLQQRVRWHREHQKHCNCRPVPKKLQQYI